MRLIKRAMLAGALLLTACSGDDDDADTTTSTARATTTTAPSSESTEPEAEPEATYTFGFLAPGEGQLAPFVPEPGAGARARRRGHQRGRRRARRAGPSVRDDEAADEPLETIARRASRPRAPTSSSGPSAPASAGLLVPLLAERQLLACSASATATSLHRRQPRQHVRPHGAARRLLRAGRRRQVMAPADGSPPPATVMVARPRRRLRQRAHRRARRRADRPRRRRSTRSLYPSRSGAVPGGGRRGRRRARPTVSSWPPTTRAPTLVAQLVDAGYPVEQIVGLDGLLVPATRRADVPRRPDAGRRAARSSARPATGP